MGTKALLAVFSFVPQCNYYPPFVYAHECECAFGICVVCGMLCYRAFYWKSKMNQEYTAKPNQFAYKKKKKGAIP